MYTQEQMEQNEARLNENEEMVKRAEDAADRATNDLNFAEEELKNNPNDATAHLQMRVARAKWTSANILWEELIDQMYREHLPL